MAKAPKAVDPSFQALAEVLALGMSYQLACSPDGSERRFLYVSESCLDLNGVTAQAVMADSSAFYDLVIPEHRELTSRVTSQAILDHRPLVVEYAIRKPDGEVAWRRATSAPRPERRADGWSIWDGLQVDITEIKSAQLELERQRQRLDLTVDAAGLGLWDYDVRADRAVWSDRTKALYGLAPDAEIRFETWFSDLIHPEDRPQMEAAYWAALTSETGIYMVEYRALAPDGSARWVQAHCRIVRDEAGPVIVLGAVRDISESRAAEERMKLVMGELAHRSKNGLSMILAIISQTARNAASIPEFEALLNARITAMAKAQDMVTDEAAPLALDRLLADAIQPFDGARFDLDDGLSRRRLSGGIVLGLALLLHELGTNATKHGALSAAGGRVSLTTEPGPPGRCVMIWREIGGPPATPPTRTGFGSRIIAAALRPQGGSVQASYPPEGFVARLEFPTLDA